jgi:type IV pilus assembly protein PilE
MSISRGFTLPELLISLAIMVSLSAIAFPSYHRSLFKSHRAVLRAAMLDLAGRQEDARQRQRAYATAIGELVGPKDAPQATVRYVDDGGTWTAQPEKDSLYRVEILEAAAEATTSTCGPADLRSPGAPTAFQAQAIGTQVGDRTCRQLLLCFAGRPGAKSASDDTGRTTPALRDTCWGLRSG